MSRVIPTFGCLIALLHLERPVIGVIDMPALKERWIGVDKEGTFFNGNRVQTSKIQTLEAGITACTGIDFFNEAELPVYNHLSNRESSECLAVIALTMDYLPAGLLML